MNTELNGGFMTDKTLTLGELKVIAETGVATPEEVSLICCKLITMLETRCSMTNNDELALKLSKLAQSAGADEWQAKKISGDQYVIRKGSYRAESGFCTYQEIAEIDDNSTRVFVAYASPANILSLLAERDADKKVIADSVVLFETLRQRIAELEARTVSVKLPETPGPMSVGAKTVYCGIVADVVGAFQAGLDAAGIKLEVGE